jgi:hypothetical protein
LACLINCLEYTNRVRGYLGNNAELYKNTKDAKYLEMSKKPLAGIKDIYLVKTPKGLAVPGEGMFRVSCDYATGVAGVMHTLYKYSNLKYA